MFVEQAFHPLAGARGDLRPTVDDLGHSGDRDPGLFGYQSDRHPALRWHAREYSRKLSESGPAASVADQKYIQGSIDVLCVIYLSSGYETFDIVPKVSVNRVRDLSGRRRLIAGLTEAPARPGGFGEFGQKEN